jgi:uncharacterized membrane protein YdjX (TVP38/TMEM64 family)
MTSSDPGPKTALGPGESKQRRWGAWVRWTAVAVVIVLLIVGIRALPAEGIVRDISSWVDGLGFWGPLVFGAVYIVGVLLLVPGSALTLAAGAVFGLLWGTVTVSIASTTAAAMAFLIARYLARDAVVRRAERAPKFRAVDRAIGEGGWKVVALLRLSPAVPYTLLNYVLGLTAVGFWSSVLASWVAMLPGTLLYVYLGYLGKLGLEAASRGETPRSPVQLVLLIVGLVATVVVTVYVTRLARREMAKVDFG